MKSNEFVFREMFILLLLIFCVWRIKTFEFGEQFKTIYIFETKSWSYDI